MKKDYYKYTYVDFTPICVGCLEKAKFDAEGVNGSSVFVCSLYKHKLRLTGNYRKIKETKMNPNCMPVEEEKDDCAIYCMSPEEIASEIRSLYKDHLRFLDLFAALAEDGYNIDMSNNECIKIYKEI